MTTAEYNGDNPFAVAVGQVKGRKADRPDMCSVTNPSPSAGVCAATKPTRLGTLSDRLFTQVCECLNQISVWARGPLFYDAPGVVNHDDRTCRDVFSTCHAYCFSNCFIEYKEPHFTDSFSLTPLYIEKHLVCIKQYSLPLKFTDNYDG